RRGMHNKGLLCGVLFVLSSTYIPQMRAPFTIFFAILIDFLPPKPPNRGAKLESLHMIWKMNSITPMADLKNESAGSWK
ncbi:MAG TPA: hypothetical protein PKW48_00985, partial [Deltaproteobacteria bacterium]|nr:hypothetical protein [Deltaproteobacteria bacterium]